MARLALITALAGALLASPALAQPPSAEEGGLDGAPPPLQLPTPKPAPADSSLKTEQARLARQADAQKAEQARLARLSADLEARKARLDAREVELTQEETRLARLRTDQEDARARQLAEREPPRAAPPPATGRYPTSPALPEASPVIRVGYDDARRACTRAGMTEAVDHDFYSARYETAPRYYDRQRELRGRMRMDDRDGYLSVDTICQLDANGAVLRFEVLR